MNKVNNSSRAALLVSIITIVAAVLASLLGIYMNSESEKTDSGLGGIEFILPFLVLLVGSVAMSLVSVFINLHAASKNSTLSFKVIHYSVALIFLAAFSFAALKFTLGF